MRWKSGCSGFAKAGHGRSVYGRASTVGLDARPPAGSARVDVAPPARRPTADRAFPAPRSTRPRQRRPVSIGAPFITADIIGARLLWRHDLNDGVRVRRFETPDVTRGQDTEQGERFLGDSPSPADRTRLRASRWMRASADV